MVLTVYLLTLSCSLPLAVYSRDFITAVVLGNDMIPRYNVGNSFGNVKNHSIIMSLVLVMSLYKTVWHAFFHSYIM